MRFNTIVIGLLKGVELLFRIIGSVALFGIVFAVSLFFTMLAFAPINPAVPTALFIAFCIVIPIIISLVNAFTVVIKVNMAIKVDYSSLDDSPSPRTEIDIKPTLASSMNNQLPNNKHSHILTQEHANTSHHNDKEEEDQSDNTPITTTQL